MRQLVVAIACPFLLALVSLEPLCSVAQAAELFVNGTPGAKLYLDGDEIAQLPMAGGHELQDGIYRLKLSRPGYADHTAELVISELNEFASLDIHLLRLQKRRAVLSSLLFAGFGQMYEGRPRSGLAFMTLQTGAIIGAMLAERSFKDHRDDHLRALRAYGEAVGESDIDAARAEANAAFSDMEDAGSLRDIAVYSIAAVGVLSALEAWWKFDGLAAEPVVESSAAGRDGAGIRLGLRRSF
jgi:hypothetical protein